MRPIVQKNKVKWKQTAKPGGGYKTFRRYVNKVLQFAGTASLEKELKRVLPNQKPNSVPPKKLAAGDVFIEGGFPGHSVIVVDTAKNDRSEQIFLIAQSYMPAQQIHILKNTSDPSIGPWYKYEPGAYLQTPEWGFGKNSLRRFTGKSCQRYP